jgi:hypothetical protein
MNRQDEFVKLPLNFKQSLLNGVFELVLGYCNFSTC